MRTNTEQNCPAVKIHGLGFPLHEIYHNDFILETMQYFSNIQVDSVILHVCKDPGAKRGPLRIRKSFAIAKCKIEWNNNSSNNSNNRSNNSNNNNNNNNNNN